MNEIKGYTPGPWKVDRPYIRGAGRVIATLESGRNEGEDAANARLIAAAPELFEALENLMDFLFHGKKDRQTILRATAALAKARGDEGEGC